MLSVLRYLTIMRDENIHGFLILLRTVTVLSMLLLYLVYMHHILKLNEMEMYAEHVSFITVFFVAAMFISLSFYF